MTASARLTMDGRMKSLFLMLILAGTVIVILTVLSQSQSLPPHTTFTIIDLRTNRDELGLDFYASYQVENKSRLYRIKQHSTPYLKIRTPQSYNNRCSKRIELPPYQLNHSSSGTEMFFLETAGRSWLTPREACALESAAKLSNLRVNMIFTSPFLDTFDNSTCYLYMKVNNIHFYTINLASMFNNTPLQGFEKRKSLAKSKFRHVHLSDALRLALVYKAGGFYSDLDTVTIRDLSRYRNVIGATLKDKGTTTFHLANGEFHFNRSHPLLLHTMKSLVKVYRGEIRNEIGPLLLTQAVKTLYKVVDVGGLATRDLTVMPSSLFYPAKSYQVTSLWKERPMSFSDWSTFLQNSSMVHFYGSQSNMIVVERRPSHELYAVLGPRYCPVSYWSSQHF